MDMTIDQMVDFLADSFKEIDKETLFLILQANQYNLERTLDVLISMESDNKMRDNTKNLTQSNVQTTSLPNPGVSKKSGKRGAKVTLPDDFLRVPGYNEKRKEYVETGSLVNLLADPLFLQELEREFGPDYQSVLREHLQAEALRNTADRAPYSDIPTNSPPQTVIDSSPRQFYVRPSSVTSASPALYTPEYYNRSPPPYSHSNLTVGQQQPAVLSHQSSSQVSTTQSSTSWFTSPPQAPPPSNSSSSTDNPRSPLIGFGGGDPPPENDGPSISERFQNLLKSFTSPFSSEPTGEQETKGLLHEEEDDGEEGTWEGDQEYGIQMEGKKKSTSSYL